MNWTVDMIRDDKIIVTMIYMLGPLFVAAVSPSFIATSSGSMADAGGLLKNAPIPPDGPVPFPFLVFFGSRVWYESSGSLRTSGKLS